MHRKPDHPSRRTRGTTLVDGRNAWFMPQPVTSNLATQLAPVRLASGVTVGGVRSRTALQFGLVGDGKLSTRTLVPESAAAASLLRRPDAGNAEQALRGVLRLFDDAPGEANVQHITLARSNDAFAVNRTFGMLPATSDDPAAVQDTARDLPNFIASMARKQTRNGVLAEYSPTSETMHFGPDVSRVLLASPASRRADTSTTTPIALGAVVHELQHSVTPTPMFAEVGAAGVEEAAADVLTWQRPVFRELSHTLGMPVAMPDKSRPLTGYDDIRRGMQQLMILAGADMRTKSGYARASSILQGGESEQMPARIAAAIGAKHGLSDDAVAEIANRTGSLFTDVDGELAGAADVRSGIADIRSIIAAGRG